MANGPPSSAAGPSQQCNSPESSVQAPAPYAFSARPPSPSLAPPPAEFHDHWDAVLKSFLTRLGLVQALRGFEMDILVMNSEWERKNVPDALRQLKKDLLRLSESKDDSGESTGRSLDERKLDYDHFANGAEPRSQTSTIKSISQLLARNRARNDASNRAEFLQPPRLNLQNNDVPPPSCARTDAKPIDRDVQMKYDIAKNEEGPLRRTMRQQNESEDGKDGEASRGHKMKRRKIVVQDARNCQEDEEEDINRVRQGMHERLANVEAHLAVCYVPSRPRSFVARLNYLEDHIIQLEKEYPPWAALHFNQPHRGWPPPPRPAPIVVPSHLTSTTPNLPAPTATVGPSSTDTKGRQVKTKSTSSLHRAVMERLEVQKAVSDFRGSNMGQAA